MTGNRHVSEHGKFRFDIMENVSTMRVIRHWNEISGEAVEFRSVEMV